MKTFKINSQARAVMLFLGLLCYRHESSGQCFITTTGSPCAGNQITFNCNSIGASNYNWNFNGEGSNTSSCSPAFVFNTSGTKVISLSMRLPNGQTCSAMINLTVNQKPEIRFRRIGGMWQCFANNSFCFTDSSLAFNGATIKKRTAVFSDGTKYTFSGNGPVSFCHSFQDPAGGSFGVTIEVEDDNGCITKTSIPVVARVRPSLGLSFTTPQPKRCDSVKLCITNRSAVLLDSIAALSWDWGDGLKDNGSKNTPNLWKAFVPNGICHWYKTQGPNSGNFDVKLSVTTNSGCTETFTFQSAATNLFINPVVLADFDSVCISSPTVTFRLKDGPVPGAANPLYMYEQPFNPPNFTRAWTGSHAFPAPGPYKINFSFTHTIPGCGRTVYDTILVLGPQSIIEGSTTAGMQFITDSLRYSCVIKDTVRFTNFSKFYHNDTKMLDDDSTFNHPTGFNKPLGHVFTGIANQTSVKANPQNRGNAHVNRIWDFDDEYCERCTTDTKKGVNINRNCRYSKDSLPWHMYTPWDKIYQEQFAHKPSAIMVFNRDSGYYYRRNLWSDDSVAIVRDTVLYYGDNPLAIVTKDSVIYSTITKKVRTFKHIAGISRTDFSVTTRFYVPAGDTIYIDANNGLPPNRWIGPRYINVVGGYSLVLKSKTDKALYNVWIETSQDTIPLHMVDSSHRIWKKERVYGYVQGDSVSPAAHRQMFYSGEKVRCFNVKLWQKDIKHPMACANEKTAPLSLMPASARGLRKAGVQCYGSDVDAYGITFILDETKPGCSRTWAEINFDTAFNRNGWVPAIGKNLGPGSISAGDLPPVNFPYGVPFPDYARSGPAPSRFSTIYTSDMVKDRKTGYVHVGLIVGNGIWPNKIYPQTCHDTAYYHNFARFPVLDNRFRVIKPSQGSEYTHICRKDSIHLGLNGYNTSNMEDVKTASWVLSSETSGKYFNVPSWLRVDETYKRFSRVHPDTPYLVDKLSVVRRSHSNGVTVTTDSQEFRIAKITKWHNEADIYKVYHQVEIKLQGSGIKLAELGPAQIADLVWNGKGTIGKPYTGSRGILDTTGFGHLIQFRMVADQKQTLHVRDTSLQPLDKTTGPGGTSYHVYSFIPPYAGFYTANLELNAGIPESCPKTQGQAKKVIVGFYANMGYTDTILCHGQPVNASPVFRYFEVYPEITFRLLDPVDYWRARIGEAGNPKREGYTITDLNKADDDLSKPQTIFGGFPYSVTGLDNRPSEVLQLGGLNNGIYYGKDTGAAYVLRTAAADSFGCRDTFVQEIYTTAARAKFKIIQSRPQCNTIIELFDSSYIIDPHKARYGLSSDKIVKWTVDWGDKKTSSVVSYFDSIPQGISHVYTYSGIFHVKVRVESALGCSDWDSIMFSIPDRRPEFDTSIKRIYCINEKVTFKNLSKYMRRDSMVWIWEFGDNTFGNQYDTITSANDTMNHRYKQPGIYSIMLYGSYYKTPGGGATGARCSEVFPDTTENYQRPFTIKVIDCDTTGIREVRLSNVSMFPNPAHHTVTISGKAAMNIEFIDATGRMVKSARKPEGDHVIDIRGLSPGIYLVRGDGKEIGKLLVE